MGVRQPSIPESVKLHQPVVFADHDNESQKFFSDTVKTPHTARVHMGPNAEKFSQLTFNDRFTKSMKTGRDIFSAGTNDTNRTNNSLLTNQQLQMIQEDISPLLQEQTLDRESMKSNRAAPLGSNPNPPTSEALLHPDGGNKPQQQTKAQIFERLTACINKVQPSLNSSSSNNTISKYSLTDRTQRRVME